MTDDTTSTDHAPADHLELAQKLRWLVEDVRPCLLSHEAGDLALAHLLSVVDDMRSAMKPFVDCADQIDADEDGGEWAKFRLLVKDFRAVRKAYIQSDPRRQERYAIIIGDRIHYYNLITEIEQALGVKTRESDRERLEASAVRRTYLHAAVNPYDKEVTPDEPPRIVLADSRENLNAILAAYMDDI